jgi:hypothetical protein
MFLQLSKAIGFFSGIFLLLLLNISFVQAASTVPSIEITGGLAGVCSDSHPALPVFVNVTDNSSDSAVMSVEGVGTVFTYAENDNPIWNGPNIYGLAPDPYNVAAGTPVTITITTYNGLNQTGGISYIAEVVFHCDTGEIISLSNGPPATSVPTMTEWGMILFIAIAGLGAVYYLKRQRRTDS